MRLSMRAEHDIPIYLATLSPKMLHADRRDRGRLAGHQLRARGRRRRTSTTWTRGLPRPVGSVPTSTSARAPRSPSLDDEDELRGDGGRPQEGAGVQPGRHGLRDHELLQQRLQPPGLGRRGGRGPERWQAGDRDGAAALVTDEMVLAHHTHRHRGHGARAAAASGATPASTPSASTPPARPSTTGSPRWAGPSNWSVTSTTRRRRDSDTPSRTGGHSRAAPPT